MGITRILIVGVAALILAPMPPEDTTVSANQSPVAELQTHQLVSVAIGTFTDVSSFCERQPLTCRAMSDVASIAQAKAKYSIRLAYEWANGAATSANAAHPAADDAVPVFETHYETYEMPEPDATGGKSISDLLNSSSADPLITGSTTKIAAAGAPAPIHCVLKTFCRTGAALNQAGKAERYINSTVTSLDSN